MFIFFSLFPEIVFPLLRRGGDKQYYLGFPEKYFNKVVKKYIKIVKFLFGLGAKNIKCVNSMVECCTTDAMVVSSNLSRT